MDFAQAVDAIVASGLPVQLGLDRIADANDVMDYQFLMTKAQERGIGWLWWDWHNPFDPWDNHLSANGTSTNLKPVGTEVVNTHPASIRATSRKACKAN